MELLFTASEHKFSSPAFHKYCDDIPDTLVLVRTHARNTIAGYTHYKWNHVSDGDYVNDKLRKVLLLQLNLREVYVPQRD